MYDYRIPVTSWPHSVRIRWANSIATLVLFDREQLALRAAEMRITPHGGTSETA